MSMAMVVWYFPLMLLWPIRRAAVIMLVVIPSPMKRMTFLVLRSSARSRTSHVASVLLPLL